MAQRRHGFGPRTRDSGVLPLRQLRVESERARRPTGAVRPSFLADARVPRDRRGAGGRARRGAPLPLLHEPHVRGAAERGGEDGDGDAGAGECEGEAARCGRLAERRRAGRGVEEEVRGLLEEGRAGDGGGDGREGGGGGGEECVERQDSGGQGGRGCEEVCRGSHEFSGSAAAAVGWIEKRHINAWVE